MFHLRKRTPLIRLALGLLLVFMIGNMVGFGQATLPETPDPLPPTQREVLLNDMPVVLAQRPGTSSVSLVLLVKVGATFDRAGKAGLAKLTADSLMASAGPKGDVMTRAMLQEDLSDAGAQLAVTTDWDSTRIEISGPQAQTLTLIQLLGRIATLPTFDETDFNRVKQDHLTALGARSAGQLADELFLHALYGPHPYGHTINGTPESVGAITRFDVMDFYKRHYLSNNSTLIVVGDVTMSQILPSFRRAFGGWTKGKPAPYTFLPPTEFQGTRIVFHPDPTKAEVAIRVGGFSTNVGSSDAPLWNVVERVLTQRLAPEAATVETRFMADSPWMVRARCEPRRTVETVETILKTLKDVRAGQGDGWAAAKAAAAQPYEDEPKTNMGIARALTMLERYRIGRRTYAETPRRLAALDPAQLPRVLENLGEKKVLVVVAGGGPDLEAALGALGTVTTPPAAKAEPAKPNVP